MDFLVLSLDLVGVVVAAIAGSIVGIKKEVDIFGVTFLGCTTALGGGIIRDLVIGNTPPASFVNHTFISFALATSFIVFLIAYKNPSLCKSYKLDNILNVLDALVIGLFTVNGMNVLIFSDKPYTFFLALFVGVSTGVGGGMIRDVLINEVPFVLRKRIYAVASISGGVLYYLMFKILKVPHVTSMVVSIALIFALRMCATKYQWNLPKVKI